MVAEPLAGDFALFISPGDFDMSFTGAMHNEDNSVSLTFDNQDLVIVNTSFGYHWQYNHSSLTYGYWYVSINATGYRQLNNLRIHPDSQWNNNIFINLGPLYCWTVSPEDEGCLPSSIRTSDYNQAWDQKNVYTSTESPSTSGSLLYDSNGLFFYDIAGLTSVSVGDWFYNDGLEYASNERIQIDLAE